VGVGSGAASRLSLLLDPDNAEWRRPAPAVSHLRFGPRPIHAPYLIQQASFVGCHQFQFIERHHQRLGNRRCV